MKGFLSIVLLITLFCFAANAQEEASEEGQPQSAPGTEVTEPSSEPAAGGTLAEPDSTEPEAGGTLAPSSGAGPDDLLFTKTVEFLPRSYLYWGTPTGDKWHSDYKEWQIFQAQFVLHLPILSNLRKQAFETEGQFAGALTFSMEADLRMISQKSMPVRMPSYKPGGTAHFFSILERGDKKNRGLFGASVGFYHYSNGQDGCTFEEYEYDETAACTLVFERLQDPVDELNRKTGQFSTNRLALGLNYKRYTIDDNQRPIRSWAVGVIPDWNIIGMIDDDLHTVYGWGRIEANTEWMMKVTDHTLLARGVIGISPGGHEDVPMIDGSVEGAYFPPFKFFGNVGFFVRFFAGRDTYNAFFVDQIIQGQIGITYKQFRELRFHE